MTKPHADAPVKVASLRERSGQGHDLTQPDPDKQPTLVSGWIQPKE